MDFLVCFHVRLCGFVLVIIPFGISTNDTYEVALNGVDGNYFKLRAWNKVGTWANGEISFGVIIIFK